MRKSKLKKEAPKDALAEVISLAAYRALRESGHRPDLALWLLRDTQFRVGDIVRDKEGGPERRVVAVEEDGEDTILGLEGEYGGEPMSDAKYFIKVKRGVGGEFPRGLMELDRAGVITSCIPFGADDPHRLVGLNLFTEVDPAKDLRRVARFYRRLVLEGRDDGNIDCAGLSFAFVSVLDAFVVSVNREGEGIL